MSEGNDQRVNWNNEEAIPTPYSSQEILLTAQNNSYCSGGRTVARFSSTI